MQPKSKVLQQSQEPLLHFLHLFSMMKGLLAQNLNFRSEFILLNFLFGEYLKYQIKSGAQVVQIFDSWAGQLSPQDYDIFAGPYQKKVVDIVKEEFPDTPIILYISGSAGVLERMAKTGVDIISLDWTVDIEEACKRIPTGIGIQGNVDPGILFGNKDSIKERIDNTFNKVKERKYILNLGHGILPGTPEENAQTFFEHGKKLTY